MEAAREKVVGKQTSLDQHLRILLARKNTQGSTEEKKDKSNSHSQKKYETTLLEL